MVAAGYGWEDVLVAHGPQWGRIWFFYEVKRQCKRRNLKEQGNVKTQPPIA